MSVSQLKYLFGEDAGVLKEKEFQLLLLANGLGPLGTALITPILNSLIIPFGASVANIGLMVSFFTAPSIVMIPIAGVLADRYGRKLILIWSLILFGIAGTAIAFTTNFHIVLSLRMAQGLAFGGLTPIIVTCIGDFYAGTKEATAQGLRFTASGVSLTVFPLVAGLLVLSAWQYPFLLYFIALPVALMVQIWFEESATSVSQTKPVVEESESYSRALFSLARQPRVIAILLARSLPNVLWYGFLTYNSIIVVRLLSGTPADAGILAAIASFAFGVAGSQSGRVTALFDSRFIPLMGANLFLSIGFTLVLFTDNFRIASIGMAIVGVGIGFTQPLYRSIITGLAPQSLRGGLVSIAESGSRVTSTLTPLAMGVVIVFLRPVVGFNAALQLAGLTVALVSGGGGLLCLIAAKKSPPLTPDRV